MGSLLKSFERWQAAIFRLSILRGAAEIFDPLAAERELDEMEKNFLNLIVETYHNDFVREAASLNCDWRTRFSVIAPSSFLTASGQKMLVPHIGDYLFDQTQSRQSYLALFSQKGGLCFFPVKKVERVETFGHSLAVGAGDGWLKL